MGQVMEKKQISGKKVLLLTDLDNTMIYSHRRQIGEDKVAVEPYQGRIVSYMTRYSYEALQHIPSDVLFVPVTTRSVSQYRRISFAGAEALDPAAPADRRREPASGFRIPRFALASNGGTLLVDGEEDLQWREKSLELIAPCQRQLLLAEELLEADSHRSLDVRRVDGFFVFTKSEAPLATMERLKGVLDPAQVDVRQNGSKIYVIPKALDKGAGVRRFLQFLQSLQEHGSGGAARREQMTVICAGDSQFDVSFLREGNVVFCPEELGPALAGCQGSVHRIGPGEVLSDALWRYIEA